jgi:predicted nucleotidyltransferase component of viral defense system
VRALDAVEMIAEKVRAAFQRVTVRDLYDLHRFATTPFDGELLRRLAVLKLQPRRSATRRDPRAGRVGGVAMPRPGDAVRRTSGRPIAGDPGPGRWSGADRLIPRSRALR